MNPLVRDLQRTIGPVVTTHGSWVFLGEDRVLKVKRPVDLGFLDYSTLEKRRVACEAEVRLNRRLAPDVYRGVVALGESDRGCIEVRADSGDIVDWAVEMRRLPEDRRADVLLAGGELDGGDVDAIAARLARFHEECATGRGVDEWGSIEATRANVEENFAQTGDSLSTFVDREEAREIRRGQRRFLDEHRARFGRRRLEGRIREGHGDLRLEHVYLEKDPERITVVDGIEFDIRYRAADTAADLAFLAMDLAWRGAEELAERLLSAYLRETGDAGMYPMIDFWESYRAFVRGKVSSLVALDSTIDASDRSRAKTESRRFFLLSLAAERRPVASPMLVVVGGWIASGKSTLARKISERWSIPVLESDRERKRMLGRSPTDRLEVPPFDGPYGEEISQRVMGRLRKQAAEILWSGRSVVLDASFRRAWDRRMVRRLARRLGVPFLFVECRAKPSTCRRRLVRRDEEPDRTTDGRLEILEAFIAAWEPVVNLPTAEHLVLDTEVPIGESMERLAGRLPGWVRA